jgi:hypothetical protein
MISDDVSASTSVIAHIYCYCDALGILKIRDMESVLRYQFLNGCLAKHGFGAKHASPVNR